MRMLVAAGFAVLVLVRPAHGQEGLEAVVTLTAEGRSAAARNALMRWWDERWTTASRLDKQQALWMRARLTVDPELAELDYQRLVVEYPGGPYSDQAVNRLAQLAVERGDLRGAARYYAELVERYPASGHAIAAGRWLGENARAIAELPDEVEVRSREGEVDEPDSTATVEPEPDPAAVEPGPDPRAAGGYAVQIGAFSDLERARSLAERAAGADFEVRLVRIGGSALVRVRSGRFIEQEAAMELMRALKARGFEVALVTDATREEPIS